MAPVATVTAMAAWWTIASILTRMRVPARVFPAHPPAHPSQTQGPASGLTFQVERMEMAGRPAVTMPQLVAVMVPEAALPERQLFQRRGGCRADAAVGGWVTGSAGWHPGSLCGAAALTAKGKWCTGQLPCRLHASAQCNPAAWPLTGTPGRPA